MNNMRRWNNESILSVSTVTLLLLTFFHHHSECCAFLPSAANTNIHKPRPSFGAVVPKETTTAATTPHTIWMTATTTTVTVTDPSDIDGLYPESTFQRYDQIDTTLQALVDQLFFLLLKPLSISTASLVYATDMTLIGPKGEELASSIEELVSLSTTLVTATAAARQAPLQLLVFNFLPNTTTTEQFGSVNCEFIINQNVLSEFHIKWQTQLQMLGRVEGESKLTLNENGKVSKHQLLNIQWNGQEINAIGETLATMRRAVKSASSLLDPFVPPLWKEVQDELLLRQKSQDEATFATRVPLPTWTILQNDDEGSNNQRGDSLLLPLPGSSTWNNYSSAHKSLTTFVKIGIPILSTSPTKETIVPLFANQAKLCGMDGSTVCQGGSQVANFYRTLASLRQGKYWTVQNVVGDWETRSVVVTWNASTPLAAAGQIQGKDCFRLDKTGLVECVEQMELVVAGSPVEDPDWFRALVSAIEAGRSNAGTDLVLDLLEQVNPSRRNTIIPSQNELPPLSETAAASVYSILVTLHSDLRNFLNLTAPPASEFYDPNIELRGYLNEVLVRGETQYKQILGVTMASFRGTIRTGRLAMDVPPKATVEFQSDRSIRVSLLLQLRIKVVDDVGVPLKLELVSLYKTNRDGKIQLHRLLESRVNGQLTPGDVVIQLLTNGPPENFIVDAFNWARSFGVGGPLA